MSSNWEKSLREQKPRRHPKNPSFSTILLDEMFRSIDGGDEKCDDRKPLYREQSASTRTTSSNNGLGCRVLKAASSSSVEDEEVASLKRAYLMEKKINDKVKSRRTSSSLPDMESSRSLQDNDPMFFSTSSSSSSDSSSGGLSLSDAEFYGSAKSRTSCFYSSRPKPNKANNYPVGPLRCLNRCEQSEYYLFDDYHSHHHHHHQTSGKAEENLIKTKSTALKIYSNLKKVKQPISPGGRLTNFINSLFTNGNAKKTTKSVERKAKSTTANAAAAATWSSFSRSCLNKNALDQSRAKYDTSGATRTVRFYPVGVIVDEDSRPCGHKSTYDDVEFHKQMEKNRKVREDARDFTKGYHQDQKKRDYFIQERLENVQHYEDEDEDIDAASDSSSDLFEIDHLALFAERRFCDELPVYETTHLDRNRAIC